jgi:1-acyl-sn-glycerol-3-phosphate acyltransferase
MLGNLRAFRRLLLLFLVIISLLATVLALALLRGRTLQLKHRIARVMQAHLKMMASLSGLRIQVHGPRPQPGQSFLLLSNHVSYWDIIAIGSLFPLGFMAKDDIARWPLLGTVIRLCNTIFVRREHALGRWQALRTLQRSIRELPYCVFPEGTTTAALAPRLAQWRRGNIAVLREPGVDVWLAGLHYKNHKEQAWIDDDALLPHLFCGLRASSIELSIHLQPLKLEPELGLSQAALSAWRQTASLCQKAQYDWSSSAGPDVMQLCKNQDSAVS